MAGITLPIFGSLLGTLHSILPSTFSSLGDFGGWQLKFEERWNDDGVYRFQTSKDPKRLILLRCPSITCFFAYSTSFNFECSERTSRRTSINL